jgi:hypothetical protein
MIKLYRQEMAFPHASGITQDIMNSGLIASDTDFTIYSKAGVPGCDFALVENRWVYHTAFDAEGLLTDHTIAHMGASVMAIVEGLSKEPMGLALLEKSPEYVNLLYGDILGRSMWTNTHTGFGVLALLTVSALAIGGSGWMWMNNAPSAQGFARARAGLMNFAVVFVAFLVATICGFLFPWMALLVNPFAVSAYPMVVLGLAWLAELWGSVLFFFVLEFKFPFNSQQIHRGVIYFWVSFLIGTSFSCFLKISFFTHWYWYGVGYFLSVAFVSVLQMLFLAPSNPTTTRRWQIKRYEHGSAIHQLLSRGKFSTSWGYFINFCLAFIFPGLINFDLASMFFNGLAFTVQEGSDAITLAILASFLTAPLGVNAYPIWIAIKATTRRATLLILSVGLLAVMVTVMCIYPANALSPVKVDFKVEASATASIDSNALASTSRVEISVMALPENTMVVTRVGKKAPSIPNFIFPEGNTFIPSGRSVHKITPIQEFPQILAQPPRVYVQQVDSKSEITIAFPPQTLVSCTSREMFNYTAKVASPDGLFREWKGNSYSETALVSPTATLELKYQIGTSINPKGSIICNVGVNDGSLANSIYEKSLKIKPNWISLATNAPRPLCNYQLNVSLT